MGQRLWIEGGCPTSQTQNDPRLLAEAEPCDQFAIPVNVAVIEVPQLPAPLANKLEKATTRVIVVLVRLQVRGEVLYPLREDGHLNFR